MSVTQLKDFSDFKIGQIFQSRPYLITSEEIKAFASLYDPQPFHLDENAANASFFKGLAASGWQTAAISMRLLTECIPLAGGLIGAGVEELRWLKPVRPNDTLQMTCEVLKMRVSQSKPHQGFITLKTTLMNQYGESIQVCVSTIVVPTH